MASFSVRVKIASFDQPSVRATKRCFMAVADFSSRMGNLSGVTEKERSSPLRQAPQKKEIFISDGFREMIGQVMRSGLK
jgi:hypothetical protein